MLERGRQLPGGDHPLLTWINGSAEDTPLHPPYGLITAAASLHWMAWEIVLPRFRDLLVPGGVLAIVEQRQAPQPWDDALIEVITRYSTNRFYQPYDLIAELEQRGLFPAAGPGGDRPGGIYAIGGRLRGVVPRPQRVLTRSDDSGGGGRL